MTRGASSLGKGQIEAVVRRVAKLCRDLEGANSERRKREELRKNARDLQWNQQRLPQAYVAFEEAPPSDVRELSRDQVGGDERLAPVDDRPRFHVARFVQNPF